MSESSGRTYAFYEVAIMLVMVHFGTGFLIGTGEKALTNGIAGSLYAVSTALGILTLLVFSRFYWRTRDKIWMLLGDKYGPQVRTIIGLMSLTWMIGVVASQIVGGAAILGLLGVPQAIGMFGLTTLVVAISLLRNDKRLVWLFEALLALSTLALVYTLIEVGGLHIYWQAFGKFWGEAAQINIGTLLGVSLATMLLTSIGMDFHPYIVAAKSPRIALYGCLLAALILFALAFLPSATVVAAESNGILPNRINGAEVIPFAMRWAGNNVHSVVGIFLILSLLVVSLGSGGAVLRAMNDTIPDFSPKTYLFTFGIPFLQELDEGMVSPGLHEEFKKHQIILRSENSSGAVPTVEVRRNESRWLIRNGTDKYLLENQEPGTTNVFQLTSGLANDRTVAIVSATLALLVAFSGKSIIDLIVSFYAVYVGGVFVPFVCYFLEAQGYLTFTAKSIRRSLILGSISSVLILILVTILPEITGSGNADLTILLVGLSGSAIGIILGGRGRK